MKQFILTVLVLLSLASCSGDRDRPTAPDDPVPHYPPPWYNQERQDPRTPNDMNE